jgi:hypothetical protein
MPHPGLICEQVTDLPRQRRHLSENAETCVGSTDPPGVGLAFGKTKNQARTLEARLTPALADCVVVVPPNKGLHAIRFDAIDSIASEVEKASG